MENTTTPVAPKSSRAMWWILVILVIILIGLFMAKSKHASNMATSTGDQIQDNLKNQTSSDDVNAIQADLNATDVSKIDAGADVLK